MHVYKYIFLFFWKKKKTMFFLFFILRSGVECSGGAVPKPPSPQHSISWKPHTYTHTPYRQQFF